MSHFKVNLAAHYVRQGGIIAYPTEAVYGLGCDPFNANAVLKLLALKRRPVDKGVILIAANFEQIQPFILPLTTGQKRHLDKTWPGPTTWLLPARPSVPRWITGKHERIALRITAHPIARALCETVGHPIVSTSANTSQHRPAKTPLTIRHYFNNDLDYILTGPLGGLEKPTPIKDLITGKSVR